MINISALIAFFVLFASPKFNSVSFSTVVLSYLVSQSWYEDLPIDIIYWLPVTHSKGMITHLEAPAAVGPVFCNIRKSLIIKTYQLLQMFIPPQEII